MPMPPVSSITNNNAISHNSAISNNNAMPHNSVISNTSITSTINSVSLASDFSCDCCYMHSPFFPNHLRLMGFFLDEEAVLNQLVGPVLTPPPRVFTLYELENYYNGQNGTPAYVAASGIVFDVTNSPAWAGGSHFSLTPGHDYSAQFTVCHCNDLIEMSKRVPVLGRIIYA